MKNRIDSCPEDSNSSEESKREERKHMNTVMERLEAKSTITKSGQITFPAKFIKKLGLKEGDQLHFVLDEDGQIHVEPVQLLSVNELFGMFDLPEDEGNFVLDLNAAREDQAEKVLGKYNITGGD